MIEVRPSYQTDAQSAGALLGASGTSDVVDALLADAALPGDQLLTSDPGDLTDLLRVRDVSVRIVPV